MNDIPSICNRDTNKARMTAFKTTSTEKKKNHSDSNIYNSFSYKTSSISYIRSIAYDINKITMRITNIANDINKQLFTA